MPSDHALVSIVKKTQTIGLDTLVTRSSRLGDHAVLQNKQTCNLVKSQLKYSTIDPEQFINAFSRRNLQPLLGGDIDAVVSDFKSLLFECSRDSKSHNHAPDRDASVNWWECLLEETDEAQLWRAFDWRGEANHVSTASPHVASPPADIEFKDNFELN